MNTIEEIIAAANMRDHAEEKIMQSNLNTVKRACKKQDKWSWDLGQFELYTGVCLDDREWRGLAINFPDDIDVTIVRDLRLMEIKNQTCKRYKN